MAVLAATLGSERSFGQISTSSHEEGDKYVDRSGFNNISATQFTSELHPEVKDLLKMTINMTSVAVDVESDGASTFFGSKMECALLEFSRQHLGMGPLTIERSNHNVAYFTSLDMPEQSAAVVIKLGESKFRLLVKGPSEILLDKCSKIIVDPNAGIEAAEITTNQREVLKQIVTNYASRPARTVSLLYKDFEEWPLPRKQWNTYTPVQTQDKLLNNPALLGVFAIHDPLRANSLHAVESCQRAGVVVRMVTADDAHFAKALSMQCGIFIDVMVVLEGPEFRTLSRRDLNLIITKVAVLARASPEDKRLFVKTLRDLGETVAITGTSANDAPSLKVANIGFSTNDASTDAAKEASSVILLEDNFASLVESIFWGRAVPESVRKFLQFQLTINISALILTFVSSAVSDTEELVLNAVQLLWVNLITDLFACLARRQTLPLTLFETKN